MLGEGGGNETRFPLRVGWGSFKPQSQFKDDRGSGRFNHEAQPTRGGVPYQRPQGIPRPRRIQLMLHSETRKLVYTLDIGMTAFCPHGQVQHSPAEAMTRLQLQTRPPEKLITRNCSIALFGF